MSQDRQRKNALNDNGVDRRQGIPLRWMVRYGIAVVAVAAGLGLWQALTAWVGPGLATYITFYPAVMVVALMSGLGPGLLATALTNLVVEYWIIKPGAHLTGVDLVGQIIFAFMGTMLSITAEFYLRMKTKTAASRSLELERDILQSVMNGARNSHLVYLDREFNFVRVNETYAQSCGYRPDQMIGKNHFALYPNTENEAIFASVRDTGEQVVYHDKPFEFPDQPERGVTYWDWTLTPVKDTDGQVTGLVFSLFETTERKRVEMNLRKSEERLHHAHELLEAVTLGSKVLIATIDKNLQYTFFNREHHDELRQLTGKDTKIGMSLLEVLADIPEERDKAIDLWSRALKGETIVQTLPFGDSSLYCRWYKTRHTPIRNISGEIVGAGEVTTDITELINAQEELVRSEARFKLLSETAEQLIMWKDIQVVINDLCRKAMEYLGCQVFLNYLVDQKAGMLHLNAFAGIPDDEAKKIDWLDFGAAVCGCAAIEAVPIIAENIFTTPDPRTEMIKSYGIKAYACHPLTIQGEVIGTLSFGTRTRTSFSDKELILMKRVTAQVATAMERARLINEIQQSKNELEIRVKERTTDLEKSVEALKRSNMALEDFAHVASHDLQEPLRKIITFSERLIVMKQDSLSDQTRDYLARMQQAAARMQSLVQDLVKYSRLTSSPDHFRMINLGEPVKDAAKDLSMLLEETQGRIEIDKLPDVEANQTQMHQLFLNLIGNGLKYRSAQKPLIRIYSSPPSEDPFYEIYVEDNGIGFDELYLDKIFKPFQRLHGKNSPYQGTGMGLAICRRILEHHGGSITAKSEQGQGSTFIVRLPKMHEAPAKQ
jgi:PAS domain S-box-containing protein